MANTTGTIVTIGDLEIFLPEDATALELERTAGESDESFQDAKEMYSLLFSAARLLLKRSGK
jgi:hypothetical protein